MPSRSGKDTVGPIVRLQLFSRPHIPLAYRLYVPSICVAYRPRLISFRDLRRLGPWTHLFVSR